MIGPMRRQCGWENSTEIPKLLRQSNRENLSVVVLDTELEFDPLAAAEFQRLRRSFRRLGTMDLKIAAIVLVHDATLLSRNLSDFARLPGLKVEDWTH